MAVRTFAAVNRRSPLLIVPFVLVVLALAALLGAYQSTFYLFIPPAVVAMVMVLRNPRLGLLGIILTALVVPLRIPTGSEVSLYPVVLLIPAIGAVWLILAMQNRFAPLPPSPVHLPLVVFICASLVSLAIGNMIWDPMVPRKSTFIIVQLAQVAIFAFSAGALWLTAIFANNELWLKRMTITFLTVGGILAVMRVLPFMDRILTVIQTGAVDRATFWLLLFGLSFGQLLFNPSLRPKLKAALVVLILTSIYFAFFMERERNAYFVGISAAGGMLIWLRFRRMRIPIVLALGLLFPTGVVSKVVWDLAGAEDKWTESGASRLVLIQRVVEVSMRNPITGLGPAAYRPYANMKPLPYMGALWMTPQINSHNNYVDLFAHTGIVGLVIFIWAMIMLGLLAWRLHLRYKSGFLAGYINSIAACLVASLVLMFLLDWFLPFVYNVGFLGFQASVLIWLFLGGLVAIDQWPVPTAEPEPEL